MTRRVECLRILEDEPQPLAHVGIAKLAQPRPVPVHIRKRNVALNVAEVGVEVEAVAHVGYHDERRHRLALFEIARVPSRLVLGRAHRAFPRRRTSDSMPSATLAGCRQLLVDALLGFEDEGAPFVQVGPSHAHRQAVDKADRALEDVAVARHVCGRHAGRIDPQQGAQLDQERLPVAALGSLRL